jgi:Holliday junction resolvase RusA-like endonuclease
MTEATKARRLITFTINGRPQQRGSKQANVKYGKDGKPVTKDGRVLTFAKDDNEKSKEWMSLVRDAAVAVFRDELIRGPVRLTCWFYFRRPEAHYGSGKNSGRLKSSAPEHHCQTPDLSKLLRCVEDGLTGIVWADDKQVCGYGNETGKFWTTSGECAEVMIEELS